MTTGAGNQGWLLSLLILLHILLLTFWLGADLGTFYSSRWVIKTSIGAEARRVALNIMGFVDMAPRIALVLFLPSGLSLIAADPLGGDVKVLGQSLTGWPIALIWVASLVWLGLVLADHHYGPNPIGQWSRRLDLWIRLVLVPVLIGFGLYTIIAAQPFGVQTNPKWLGAKVALYGLAIGCGIMIRRNLRPFGPGFVKLMTEGSSAEVEEAIGGSMGRCMKYVATIWVLVLVIALLGVAKPGADLAKHPSSAPAPVATAGLSVGNSASANA
jgi:hypothetical protein